MDSGTREGPRVWMEVKYGTVESLKTLLKTCAHTEVSATGGRYVTSPMHEAISRVDLAMVDMLRYSLCNMECEIGLGPFKGKIPLEYARGLRSANGKRSVRRDIYWNLHREADHRPKRVQQRALCVQRRADRAKMLAFAGSRHKRLGNNSTIALHTAPDDVMRLIFQHME
jgi:hypothetical protein